VRAFSFCPPFFLLRSTSVQPGGGTGTSSMWIALRRSEARLSVVAATVRVLDLVLAAGPSLIESLVGSESRISRPRRVLSGPPSLSRASALARAASCLLLLLSSLLRTFCCSVLPLTEGQGLQQLVLWLRKVVAFVVCLPRSFLSLGGDVRQGYGPAWGWEAEGRKKRKERGGVPIPSLRDTAE